MADNANQIDFTWKGKDRRGKIIKGDIAAISEAIARAELRRQGIRIIGIKKKPKPLFSKAKSSISAKDIAVFSRQLATMLESGIPLVQSFDIVAKSNENPAMAEMLTAIKVDIEEGDTLAQSLRKRPIYFDELYCNLVEAGEHAGILESLLDKIATYKEKVETIKSKIKKALTYPIAVIVVAFIVTTIMLIFVVPVFKDLFDSFGADLPSFTLWVMGISDWMVNNWYYVVGSIIAVVYIFMYFKKRSKPFNYFLDRTLLKIPIVGMILHKSSIARFARTLATMSAAGVPLVEALESVAGATGNIVYYKAVMEMRDKVTTGESLQNAMAQANLFPHMVVQMLAIGEESGAIDKMLSKVADFYEEEVDNLVDNLSSLMEPFIMVFLGILVGGLIVAMYLPIFKLGAAIG
ncbi:MAG: type II secretion system F family protein [Gammaproteobacteria bacterium]|jgi:type IV pilus assembly protein PilC|nr:type II secretion system F family protein [Gammaproteobacteria bacterium]MBT5222536.1 type II secretion system F family protein [Gammaproteobacteria bacterium]MBT5825318.1 type II secretion system F family protein [Gammaproteobacteria bacterium]MBT6420935.1 type II secretion system F family protein [Gammaproteobacteria bacterium]MBT6576737.1 type II secretion system F family protein [Gammaproteobacteria bacterium]